MKLIEKWEEKVYILEYITSDKFRNVNCKVWPSSVWISKSVGKLAVDQRINGHSLIAAISPQKQRNGLLVWHIFSQRNGPRKSNHFTTNPPLYISNLISRPQKISKPVISAL